MRVLYPEYNPAIHRSQEDQVPPLRRWLNNVFTAGAPWHWRAGAPGFRRLPLLLVANLMVMTMSISSFAATGSPCDTTKKMWNGKFYACQSENFILSPANELTIDGGVNGSVEVSADDTPSIRVTAVRTAWLDKDETAESALQSIRIVATSSELNSSNPHSSLDQIWSVSFTVSVPKYLPVVVKTKNGSVSATGLNAGLLVATKNGAISVDRFTGKVSVTSQNGSIGLRSPEVRQGDLNLTARTQNGSIDIALPKTLRIGLEAESKGGRILVDPSFGASSKGSNVILEGENKTTAITLSTMVGNIQIRDSDDVR